MAMNVLVVEDHPLMREAITATLVSRGMNVIEAANGWAGLEMARKHIPDMIVCDYYMPHLNGVEVLKHIRNDPQTAEIPFLLMTMDDSFELRAFSYQTGVDAFILKGTEDLYAAISRLMKKANPHAAAVGA